MEAIWYFITLCLALLAWLGTRLNVEYRESQDKRIRDEEKDELKNEMKKSLLTDIERNDELLAKGLESRTQYRHIAFWHPLHIISFESVISSSDRYLSLSPQTQNKLSEYYEKVKGLNELTRKLQGEEEYVKILKISREQIPLRNELISISPELRSLLESE